MPTCDRNRKVRRTTIALLISIAWVAHADVDERVERLLARMTLEEKLGQLTQLGAGQPEFSAAVGLVGSVLYTTGAAETNELQRATLAKSRLEIPILFGFDVIHGYRTIFPIPLAMASTWDPALGELAAHIAATEARAAGIRWTFAPMVDIARDPRWGRIAEGAGEDPFLGAAMAAAYVRGFQGNDLSAPDSVLACAKHYAAYGAAEGGRDYGPVEMSEATLREVYLPPFHAAVDAGTGTLMAAFNSLNRVPATANRHLLDDILRREWKFRGFVVSDYAGVTEMIDHGIAATPQEAARKAITAGLDMAMWDNSFATLAQEVRAGRLPESVVDQAVRRVLRAKFRVGLFADPYTDEKRAAAVTLTKEHRDAARRIAQRSMILLKNEGALLPLPKSGKTIAVVGPFADSKADMLGPWSGSGKPEETVSVMEGIRSVTAVSQAMESADLIVAVLGEEREISGEAASRASLDLPDDQQRLLQSLIASGKPVVLVVMSGRPLTISWAAEHVAAIVQAWFLGSEGGNAIADVLFGTINPSGKLPVTVPRTVGQVPIYYAHLPSGRPANPGDKYTNKYADTPIGPLYPFGFGLSYTRFEYSNLKLSAPSMTMNDRLTVSAEIRNAGNRAGEEIVQFYINDPVASVSRPVKELKGFQRVALAPGEVKRVEFTVTRQQLEFWSDRGWLAEPGRFNVWIGPNSADGLHGSFELLH